MKNRHLVLCGMLVSLEVYSVGASSGFSPLSNSCRTRVGRILNAPPFQRNRYATVSRSERTIPSKLQNIPLTVNRRIREGAVSWVGDSPQMMAERNLDMKEILDAILQRAVRTSGRDYFLGDIWFYSAKIPYNDREVYLLFNIDPNIHQQGLLIRALHWENEFFLPPEGAQGFSPKAYKRPTPLEDARIFVDRHHRRGLEGTPYTTSPHAVARMLERGITDEHILHLIRWGRHNTNHDQFIGRGWRYAIDGRVYGRPVRIIIALDDKHNNLTIVTVMEILPPLKTTNYKRESSPKTNSFNILSKGSAAPHSN